MSSLTTRAIGVVVGLGLPLLALGYVDDTNSGDVAIDDQLAIEIAALPQQQEEELQVSLQFGSDLADQLENETDTERKTDEAATACCWVFFLGRWWCFPCS